MAPRHTIIRKLNVAPYCDTETLSYHGTTVSRRLILRFFPTIFGPGSGRIE
jgi:hypothetical protein